MIIAAHACSLGCQSPSLRSAVVMTLAFSRFLTATMIPSRQAGDILAGMWTLMSRPSRTRAVSPTCGATGGSSTIAVWSVASRSYGRPWIARTVRALATRQPLVELGVEVRG